MHGLGLLQGSSLTVTTILSAGAELPLRAASNSCATTIPEKQNDCAVKQKDTTLPFEEASY